MKNFLITRAEDAMTDLAGGVASQARIQLPEAGIAGRQGFRPPLGWHSPCLGGRIMTTQEDAIDRELEQTHARLLLDLVSVGCGQGVYILSPPPADDPE